MCSGVSIAMIAAMVASTAMQAYQASQTPGAPKAPTGATPAVPSGPATTPDQSNFMAQRGGATPAMPAGLSFGPGLSAEQERSQIATGGTAGNSGIYRTPQVQQFYKDLAFKTLTNEQGNPIGEPTGVERQYAQDVLGVQPQAGSTASFLSALLRS